MNLSKYRLLTRPEQSLFGLPFIFSAVVLSLVGQKWSEILIFSKLIWILPAFLSARISGMAFNQLIDRDIDARNPRTEERVIPKGRVSPFQAAWIAWGALALFLLCCSRINLLCLLFAPFAAFLLVIYSYMKRISSLCHFVLGMIHFLSPFMTWMVLRDEISWPPFFLGLSALFLIAGNDILYAVQDYSFDLQEGLHTILTRFGIKKGLIVARGAHFLACGALFAMGLSMHFGPLYYGALPCVVGAFIYMHTRFVAGDERRFFLSNASISAIILGLNILGALTWPGLL